MLKENLANVEKNIEQACKNAGRNRNEVTLIAVSKTKPVEMLQEIYDENIRDFGENKVQELCSKMEQLPSDRLIVITFFPMPHLLHIFLQ